MRQVFRVLVVPLALLLLVSAGCSSGRSSSTPPSTSAPTTNTSSPSSTVPDKTIRRDLAAARRAFSYVNRAFGFHLVDGQQALASANYYVWSGRERQQACVKQWVQGNGGATRVDLAAPSSWVPAPQWRDPLVGQPQGRVYAAKARVTFTDAATGSRTHSVQPMHVTVLPNGDAKLFLSCTDPILTFR